MIAPKKYIIFLLTLILIAFTQTSSFCDQSGHIEQLFDLRSSIIRQGNVLPAKIKNATKGDVRTLERVFELNTSVLTTIEAYFRIFKIAVSTGARSNAEIMDILNEWLAFIGDQCRYDIEYLDEALKETTNREIAEQIKTARKNIESLSGIVSTGLRENENMLEKAVE